MAINGKCKYLNCYHGYIEHFSQNIIYSFQLILQPLILGKFVPKRAEIEIFSEIGLSQFVRIRIL